jgi:molybdate transport system permease protein
MNLSPIWISLQLAGVTVTLLLVLGTPLAAWLAMGRSRARDLVDAVVALLLVLPPTVLGFYLIVLLGPDGLLGAPWVGLTGETLSYGFTGLVITSVIYSLPFVVQPLRDAFRGIGRAPLETAATLGATPLDAFTTIAGPLAARGVLTAAVLGFMHTLGAFGAILMLGGGLPGETRTVSIAVFEQVTTLEPGAAHGLAAGLLITALLALSAIHALNGRQRMGLGV